MFNCQAGDELNSVILKILLDIYDLVSTTVSGIPMKEESNPGASISYDVELLHRRESHLLLKTCGLLEKGSQLIARKDHGNFDTVKLKWLSPSQKLKSEMVSQKRIIKIHFMLKMIILQIFEPKNRFFNLKIAFLMIVELKILFSNDFLVQKSIIY